MIRLPSEIKNIFAAAKSCGGNICAIGSCVREAVAGRCAGQWDFVTDIDRALLSKNLYRAANCSEGDNGCRVVSCLGDNNNDNVLHIDYRDDGDIQAVDITCGLDNSRFCEALERILHDKPFALDAMAYEPSRGIIDPAKGQEDIRRGIVRLTDKATTRIVSEPEIVAETVMLVAELGFAVDSSTMEAITEHASEFGKLDREYIRDVLEYIINSNNAGMGLRTLAGANLMPYIIGTRCACQLSSRERRNFSDLTDGIDKLNHVVIRRLGLFYLCFEGDKGREAIDMLPYDGDVRQHLIDARKLLDKLYFFRTKEDLKAFIYKYGRARYEYLDNLSKAQRIVYNLSEVKIMNRHTMMQEIEGGREPIFPEDLVIGVQDIIDEGITADVDKAKMLLGAVAEVSHRHPDINNRKDLLKKITAFNNNKLLLKTRKIKWIN